MATFVATMRRETVLQKIDGCYSHKRNGIRMMYIIAWRSLVTNATGRGTVAFAREDIESYVAELNNTYIGELTHWLEPVSPTAIG